MSKSLKSTSEAFVVTTKACESMSNNIDTISKQMSTNVNQETRLKSPVSRTMQIPTVNRYEALSQTEDGEHSSTTENANQKILILGNSHVRRVRTDNFFVNCIVNKTQMSSCQELTDDLKNIDSEYDLIFLHMFSNDIRNFDPDKCVQSHIEVVEKLLEQCQFSKVIISLPFLKVRDNSFNEKVEECIITVKIQIVESPKYTYLSTCRSQSQWVSN